MIITDPDKGVHEADTFSCGHCGTVVFCKPKMMPSEFGGWCTCCNKPICPKCVGKDCDVIEKKLERWERQADFRRSYEEVL